jgi:hypothetical protein
MKVNSQPVKPAHTCNVLSCSGPSDRQVTAQFLPHLVEEIFTDS